MAQRPRIGGREVAPIRDRSGKIVRYIDPKTGRTVQETVEIVESRTPGVSTGTTRVTYTPEGTVFEQGGRIQQGTVETVKAPVPEAAATQVSPEALQKRPDEVSREALRIQAEQGRTRQIRQRAASALGKERGEVMVGGERIARSGSVGGVRYVETEGGKEYAEVGGGYVPLREYYRGQVEQRREITESLSRRQAVERLPKGQRGLIELQKAPGALIDTIAESAAGSERSFRQGFEENLRMRVETGLAASRELRRISIKYPSPKSAGRKEVREAQREFISQNVAPSIDIAAAPLVAGDVAKLIGGLRNYVVLRRTPKTIQAGREGIVPFQEERAGQVLSRSFRRPPRLTAATVDSTVAATKEGQLLIKSDILAVQRAGRSRQRILISEAGTGEQVEAGQRTLTFSESELTARRIIPRRADTVRGPRSSLGPVEKVRVDSRAVSLPEQRGRFYTYSQSVVSVGKRRFAVVGRGVGKKVGERDVSGIEQFDRPELALVPYRGESRYVGYDIGATLKGGITRLSSLSASRSRVLERTVDEPEVADVGGKLKRAARPPVTAPRGAVSIISSKATAGVASRRQPRLVGTAKIKSGISASIRYSPEQGRELSGLGGFASVYGRRGRREIYDFVGVRPFQVSAAGRRTIGVERGGVTARTATVARRGGQRRGLRRASGLGSLSRVGQRGSQAQGSLSGTATAVRTRTATRTGRPAVKPQVPFRPPRFRIRLPMIPLRGAAGFGERVTNRPTSKLKTMYKPPLPARFVLPLRSAPKSVAGFEIRPFVKAKRRKKRR